MWDMLLEHLEVRSGRRAMVGRGKGRMMGMFGIADIRLLPEDILKRILDVDRCPQRHAVRIHDIPSW